MGKGPGSFRFNADKAYVHAEEYEIEKLVSYFNQYAQMATRGLQLQLNRAAARAEAAKREQLQRELAEAEHRAKILERLKKL
jgi:hypothetical protein